MGIITSCYFCLLLLLLLPDHRLFEDQVENGFREHVLLEAQVKTPKECEGGSAIELLRGSWEVAKASEMCFGTHLLQGPVELHRLDDRGVIDDILGHRQQAELPSDVKLEVLEERTCLHMHVKVVCRALLQLHVPLAGVPWTMAKVVDDGHQVDKRAETHLVSCQNSIPLEAVGQVPEELEVGLALVSREVGCAEPIRALVGRDAQVWPLQRCRPLCLVIGQEVVRQRHVCHIRQGVVQGHQPRQRLFPQLLWWLFLLVLLCHLPLPLQPFQGRLHPLLLRLLDGGFVLGVVAQGRVAVVLSLFLPELTPRES